MKKAGVALALVLAPLGLIACNGSSSVNSSTRGSEAASGNSAGGSVVDIEAVPGRHHAFTSNRAATEAGKVAIRFTNPQNPRAVREEPLGKTHGVVIEDSSGKTVGETRLIHEGSTSTVVNLKPGTYHYFCTVPGHREAGMEGTLIVK